MKRARFFYGWAVAATLWLTFLLTTGLPYYSAGVLIAAMSAEIPIDKTTIGLGFSLLTIVWGLSGPLTARLLNRRGLRFTVVLGSLILAGGAGAIATLVHDVRAFVLVFGAAIGLGIGIGSNLPAQTGVTLWFERKRPLVMALVMTGSGVGGYLFPTLIQRVAAMPGGWRTAWLAVCAGALVSATIAALFLRDRPSDLGQWPDGMEPAAKDGSSGPGAAAGLQWTATDAVRQPAFWQVLLAAVIFSTPIPMIVAHGVSHFQGLGHSTSEAARAIGLMVLMSVPGRVLGGLLCQKFAPQRVWAAMMLLIAAGLACGVDASTEGRVLLFAGLIGLGYGASIVCWASLTANLFGALSFATVMGLMVPVTLLLTSVAPTAAGVIRDRVGSYAIALWACAAALLLGALIIGSVSRSGGLRRAPAVSNSSKVTMEEAGGNA